MPIYITVNSYYKNLYSISEYANRNFIWSKSQYDVVDNAQNLFNNLSVVNNYFLTNGKYPIFYENIGGYFYNGNLAYN